MDDTTTGQILIILCCVLLSAFFSAGETAFTSLNKVRLKSLANGGNSRAVLTLKLAECYDKLLSTILIGNNIVNIASASVAALVFTRLWGSAGVTLSPR